LQRTAMTDHDVGRPFSQVASRFTIVRGRSRDQVVKQHKDCKEQQNVN
jgi:hypothetical protein